jgi:(p)ppGpp synthase/HD superfamily hydrolase
MQARQMATHEHVIKRLQVYGVLPYTHHLERVENVLRRFGYGNDEVLMVSAWLHDIMEDCDVKKKIIEEIFGEDVADAVWRVTNESGENRKVRSLLTYPKIRESATATILKLADRIANVENGGSMVAAYKREYEDFRRGIYVQGVAEEMWKHLDDLMKG